MLIPLSTNQQPGRFLLAFGLGRAINAFRASRGGVRYDGKNKHDLAVMCLETVGAMSLVATAGCALGHPVHGAKTDFFALLISAGVAAC